MRNALHEETAKKDISVRDLWESAVEDTKVGGNLERGAVTAVILHGMIIEVGLDKIARAIGSLADQSEEHAP